MSCFLFQDLRVSLHAPSAGRDKGTNCTPVGQACFNPCFNGTCSLSKVLIALSREIPSFNPCFNGTCSLSTGGKATFVIKLMFQLSRIMLNPPFRGGQDH